MKKKPSLSSRNGLSLIEVISAIALLVTMFVFVLRVWTSHEQQMRRADRVLLASNLLNEQIATWYAVGDGPPVNVEGHFSSHPDLRWKTESLPAHHVDTSPFQLLRITVFSPTAESLFSMELVTAEQSNPMNQGTSP